MTEAGTEGHNQLQSSGHADDDADAITIEFLLSRIAGILQRLIYGNQPEQLRRINRLKRIGQNAVLHRVEINRGEEAAVLGVNLVSRLGIGVEIIV